ncbi:hypothetical protein PR048_007193 [Dryococelus australis]|uniref:Uncharacterized protein n=1 Tax=Dryococelus australis TaxID=614101 RepID=A0ABQ9ICZ3_9NEOP|nr:hypothetical protein PR048_007193 [Dryococelus australis]
MLTGGARICLTTTAAVPELVRCGIFSTAAEVMCSLYRVCSCVSAIVYAVRVSAYTCQKAKSKYRNRIRLERASQKRSSDTHKTPYDRVERCRKRKINTKASECVNTPLPDHTFTHYTRTRAESQQLTAENAGSRNPLHRPATCDNHAKQRADIGQPLAGRGSFLTRPATREDRAELGVVSEVEKLPLQGGRSGLDGLAVLITYTASFAVWTFEHFHRLSISTKSLSEAEKLCPAIRHLSKALSFVKASIVVSFCAEKFGVYSTHRSSSASALRKNLNTISAYTRQKAMSRYRNCIRLERASQKQSSDTHKTPYDRVKRCRGRKVNTKASERVNADVFTQNKRPCEDAGDQTVPKWIVCLLVERKLVAPAVLPLYFTSCRSPRSEFTIDSALRSLLAVFCAVVNAPTSVVGRARRLLLLPPSEYARQPEAAQLSMLLRIFNYSVSIAGCMNDITWNNDTKTRMYEAVIRPISTYAAETRADTSII